MVEVRGVVVLAIMVLAGCLSEESGDHSGVPGEDGKGDPDPTGNGAPPGNDTTIPSFNRTVVWESLLESECEGLVTSFFWAGPHDIPEPPNGWEPGPRAVTDVHMYGFRCERLHVGPFERGPIHTFIEFHDYQDTPDGCRGDLTATTRFRTLNNVWIDDAEVASYLSGFHGMPTVVAEFNTSTQTGTMDEEYVWRMREKGGLWSEFRVPEPEDPTPFSSTWRLFWFNETSVSYLEFNEEGSYRGTDMGTGETNPPLLMAGWHTDYVSPAAKSIDASAHAEIRHFKDMFCQEPVGGSFED